MDPWVELAASRSWISDLFWCVALFGAGALGYALRGGEAQRDRSDA